MLAKNLVIDYVRLPEAQGADQRRGYRQADYDASGNVNLARRVMFKPMQRLFNQDKRLPLRYCPIQVELELVNSKADAVTTESWEGHQNGINWDISDIQCKCDFLTLGNSLDNGYASHLLSGRSLPINLNTWNHTNQSTGNDQKLSAYITRAATRLKSIFVTLHKPDGVAYKQANDFTTLQALVLNCLWLMSIHKIQIGSELIPEYPVTSVTESFMQLKKTAGRALKCIQVGVVLVNVS